MRSGRLDITAPAGLINAKQTDESGTDGPKIFFRSPYEGLCKGAIGFDPSRGHRPSSYLVPKVNGELLHHLRDTGFAVRISHRLRELWIRARKHLAMGLSDQQIADQLDVPLERWLECRRACGQRPVPLHDLQRD